ncbi:MAG: hypothetical protein ACLFPE_01225 [Bacteroidales bacterium]
MMKTTKVLIFLAAILFAFAGCKDDDDPDVQAADWQFDVTFNITDPDVYTFDGSGVAEVETTDNSYYISADYVIGDVEYEDVTIEGAIENGKLDFDNKIVDVVHQSGSVVYTETITFSLPDISLENNTATGSGDVTIVRSDTGVSKSGTLEFTATRQ